ncbi:MAG TPA: DedA family protein [Candidatus Paceibacterota bacterium]|nr:DedA family protein [Candidatus Paceibacterota bacterium]
MALEQIISGLSYMGIFILMFSNGIFSFPSSQVLYIIVGYFVGVGTLALPTAIVAGAIGNTIGNIALYEFAREHGMNAALKFLPMKPHHVAKTERFFAKKGLGFLFIAKMLPTLKVFVPIFGGIGKAPRIPYAALMFLASTVWAFIFIEIGMFFGKNTDVWKPYSGALAVISILVVFFLWRSYKNTEEK